MKKSVKNTLVASVALVILITVLSSVFSYISMTEYFDHDIGHYKNDTPITAAAMYLPFAATIISVVCAILIRKKVSFAKEPEINIPTVFSSLLTGLLLVAVSVFTVTDGDVLSRLSFAAVIAGLISAVYFILFPFLNGKSFMMFLSFIPPVWAALKLLEEYFRVGSPINSPIRTVNLTMLAFILLFLAEEIRFYIGTHSVGIYYFCILNAIVFTGNAIIPKLAVIISGNNEFGFSFIGCCLGFGMFLFLLSRLLAAPSALTDSNDSTMTGNQVSADMDSAEADGE